MNKTSHWIAVDIANKLNNFDNTGVKQNKKNYKNNKNHFSIMDRFLIDFHAKHLVH